MKRKFFVCLFDSQFFGSVFLRSGFKTLLSRTDGALGEKMIWKNIYTDSQNSNGNKSTKFKLAGLPKKSRQTENLNLV